jgi:acetyl-CoA carboxylase biotin carboxylase subunit
MFKKILVANRGAIARRIVRACTELGVQSVVVYSPVDIQAPYIAEATEAYPLRGDAAVDGYLDQDQLLAIAHKCRADGIHPGYGFLSENSAFAQRVIDEGLAFIGPSPQWLDQMGDKVSARTVMAKLGMPIFAGSELITDVAQAEAFAQSEGFPLVVKPAGGGGGMGMQVVHTKDQLGPALLQAKAIASKAFAASGVYLERWIEAPRHIEFQIIADQQGNAMHLFERECSVQRRHQKLIEESPAPGLDSTAVVERAESCAQICAQLGYDNLGTVETLYTPAGEVGFLEMNTRIQVEHGVTEEVTGVDLVQLQISLACGGSLPKQVTRTGFAIEARLYAEDPETQFPSTGILSIFKPPKLFAVRVETGYQEGQTVSPYYDPMLAKIIARGDTREQAIGRLLIALKAFQVAGVSTNSSLLMRVLQDAAFLRGEVDTNIIQRIQGSSSGRTLH